MADRVDAPGTAPVTDRRPVPRGVLPRGVQTWLMAALAIGMLFVIFLTGQPEAPAGTRITAPTPAPASDRVRDYQERLRLLDAQAAQETRAAALANTSLPPSLEDHVAGPSHVDPVVAERKRREYESLFASNIVLSRRPGAERADAGSGQSSMAGAASLPPANAGPSIDEIADAVVRATVRSNAAVSGATSQAAVDSAAPPARSEETPSRAPTATQRINAAGPRHRVLEGTVIDTVLTNRLDGGVAAPVNCLVTNPLYSHSGEHVLIPAGARVLGETRPVQTLGDTRLAVAFHRILMPDGSSVALDQFKGVNQIGDSGLRDHVNHHYWSTFGTAGAVGLVSGLAQLIGSAGVGLGDGDRTVIIAGNAADATSQASVQVMNRFLNRLPTITVREGHRVKVYVTSDFDLPAWTSRSFASSSQQRQ